MKITKAVIPLGGYSTRFLPASKSIPKEMFPVVDKPILQYLVEELSAAGITDILFLIGRGRETLLNHLDKNPELNQFLIERNKTELLETVTIQQHLAKYHYIRCFEANGVANALLLSENFVNNEPFVVLFGDELLYNPNISSTKQLIEEFNKINKSVIGCVNVKEEDISDYGVVETEEIDNINYVKNMVEKPKDNAVNSTLVAVGKYVLTSDIFDYIKGNKVFDRENNFTQALTELAKQKGLVAKKLTGVRFDTGSKLGYVMANVFYALKDESISENLKEELVKIVKE